MPALRKEFKEIFDSFRDQTKHKEEIKRNIEEVAAQIKQKEYERAYMERKRK